MQLSLNLIFKAINERSDCPLVSSVPMWIVINASSECFFALISVPIRGFFYRKVTQTQFYFFLLIIFQTGPSFKSMSGLQLQYWSCSCKEEAAFKTDLENIYSRSTLAKCFSTSLCFQDQKVVHKTHSSIHDYNFSAFLSGDASELRINLL